MAGPTDQKLAALLELERRGELPPALKPQLDMYRSQGLAKPLNAGGGLTESQGKSTGFYGRAAKSDQDFLATASATHPRGIVGQTLADMGPQYVVNKMTGDDRQLAEQAKRDFILASLRYESGASINADEFRKQDTAFFPQPGDSDAVIAQKAAHRKVVIEGLKTGAGPGAAQIAPASAQTPQQQATLPAALPGQQPPAAPPPGPDLGTNHPVRMDGDIGFNNPKETNPLSPEQQTALDAWFKANPKATPEQLHAFGISIGQDIKNAAAIMQARAQGANVTAADAQLPPIDPGDGKPGAAERGFVDMASLNLAPRLTAIENTIRHGGTYDQRLAEQQGYRKFDEQNHPWMRVAGSLPAAVALPGGLGKTAGEMAAIAGGQGAAYGALGSRDLTNLGDVGVNALATGIPSAAGAYGVTKGINALAGMSAKRAATSATNALATTPSDVAAAGKAQGVSLLPADVGGPGTRMATQIAAATPGGAIPITKAAQRAQRQGGEALSRIAGDGATTNENAGEAATRGALSWRNTSRVAINKAYDRAAELAGDARVNPKGAIEHLDQQISELKDVPGGADGLTALQKLRDDLAGRGTVSVNGIRGMRTQLRQQFMKDGLHGSDLERRVMGSIDAASEDLAKSLTSQGKAEAANAYRQADQLYKERIDILDNTIMPIIGKKGEKSGEQVVQALNAAGKGNNRRFGGFMRTMSEDEAPAVRGTLIHNLGTAKAGQQNAAGDAFSFDTFLTNWNHLGDGAKNALFEGESRQSIDQLALLAEKARATNKFKNYSGTALAATGSLMGSFTPIAFPLVMKALAAQAGAGMILASPKTAKLLVLMSRATSKQSLSGLSQRLVSVAARDPEVAQDALGIQQIIRKAINDNGPAAGRAAASPDERPSDKK